ncbi:MAG: hypothetical protein Q4C82_08405 [Eubacteriales bacterium]|nr:hypothetical protein [Eubacteriales bacterium]
MVFKNDSWNGTGEIVVYSNYHRYWIDRARKIKNPLFDVFSGKILDLKEGKPQAIRYFYNLLKEEICDGVTICVVPSSDSEKTETGLGKLGEMLAADQRINKVYFLQRKRSIPKLAAGGLRNREVHMRSIEAVEDMSVEGAIVLLMDDVTTTGNSLYACREILRMHGADEVEMFALGKAI